MSRRHPHRTARCSAILLLGAIVGGSALASAGCRRPLLGEDEDRSQFDRYRAVRETREPAYVMDEFGRRQPNLRGRLLEER